MLGDKQEPRERWPEEGQQQLEATFRSGLYRY